MRHALLLVALLCVLALFSCARADSTEGVGTDIEMEHLKDIISGQGKATRDEARSVDREEEEDDDDDAYSPPKEKPFFSDRCPYRCRFGYQCRRFRQNFGCFKIPRLTEQVRRLLGRKVFIRRLRANPRMRAIFRERTQRALRKFVPWQHRQCPRTSVPYLVKNKWVCWSPHCGTLAKKCRPGFIASCTGSGKWKCKFLSADEANSCSRNPIRCSPIRKRACVDGLYRCMNPSPPNTAKCDLTQVTCLHGAQPVCTKHGASCRFDTRLCGPQSNIQCAEGNHKLCDRNTGRWSCVLHSEFCGAPKFNCPVGLDRVCTANTLWKCKAVPKPPVPMPPPKPKPSPEPKLCDILKTPKCNNGPGTGEQPICDTVTGDWHCVPDTVICGSEVPLCNGTLVPSCSITTNTWSCVERDVATCGPNAPSCSVGTFAMCSYIDRLWSCRTPTEICGEPKIACPFGYQRTCDPKTLNWGCQQDAQVCGSVVPQCPYRTIASCNATTRIWQCAPTMA